MNIHSIDVSQFNTSPLTSEERANLPAHLANEDVQLFLYKDSTGSNFNLRVGWIEWEGQMTKTPQADGSILVKQAITFISRDGSYFTTVEAECKYPPNAIAFKPLKDMNCLSHRKVGDMYEVATRGLSAEADGEADVTNILSGPRA